jgi:prepilin signal peptidase PulO-like enzyme (type II secretory pathway)
MSNHHIISQILHFAAGGGVAVMSAGFAGHFGYRAADRLPGESRLPQCVFCLRPLQWFESFPLFGWALRPNPKTLPCPCGKRTKLWRQPLIELVGLFLGLLAVALGGWPNTALPLCLGLGLLPAIAMIDIDFGLIPDEVNLLLGFFGFIWRLMRHGDVFLSLVGTAGLVGLGLLLALGYSKLRKREMLGLGDVKFFAAAGFWLPVTIVPSFLVLSGLFGAITGLIWKRKTGEKEFPFAPALCLALAFCIYYGIVASPGLVP